MKNKKMIAVILILVMAVSLAGCSGKSASNTTSTSGAQDSAKPIELKLATQFGPTHAVVKELLEPWAKDVETATNGKVKVTIYPVDTLLKATDIYEGILSGIADIGNNDPGYNVGRFPMLSSYFLGGIEYKNSKVSTYVAWDLVNNFNLDETKETKYMFVYGMQPGVILSKAPIRTLEDLKGKQIRVSGFAADSVKALGGVPVGMPMSEAYEALVKGTIDGNLAPSETLKGWKFAETVKYITRAPFINTVFHYVTMNKKVWDSLPLDAQEAIEEVNEKTLEKASLLFDRICDEGTEYGIKEYKNELIEISGAEKDRWIAAMDSVQEKWLADMEGKKLPGKETLDKLKETAAKYNEMYGNK